MPDTTTIRQSVLIPATAAQVYDALVNARKLAVFTGTKATGEAKVGANFTAWDGYITGRYLELQKARRIVQEWLTTRWPPGYPPSRVQFDFAEGDGATRITMVQSGVPSSQAEDYSQGWYDSYWTPLQEYFSQNTR